VNCSEHAPAFDQNAGLSMNKPEHEKKLGRKSLAPSAAADRCERAQERKLSAQDPYARPEKV
jgi:hypothetical protein